MVWKVPHRAHKKQRRASTQYWPASLPSHRVSWGQYSLLFTLLKNLDESRLLEHFARPKRAAFLLRSHSAHSGGALLPTCFARAQLRPSSFCIKVYLGFRHAADPLGVCSECLRGPALRSAPASAIATLLCPLRHYQVARSAR